MKKFDPLPSTTPVEEFDDYVAGYRYYSSEAAHMALQSVAHRLASTDLKQADVQLYSPRILFVFRELKKDDYVVAIIGDTHSSLKEAINDDRSPITQEFVVLFEKIMLAARIKLREIHADALSMSEVKEMTSSGLIPWEKGGEYDSLDVPSFAAIDEA